MGTLTKRNYRAQKLAQLTPDMFQSYQDYFIALHLNPKTAFIHSLGVSLGLLMFPYVVYMMQWLPFFLYCFFMFGFGFFSHIIFDGLIAPTNKKVKRYEANYRCVLKLSWTVMTGKLGQLQRHMFEKYPFLVRIYFEKEQT